MFFSRCMVQQKQLYTCGSSWHKSFEWNTDGSEGLWSCHWWPASTAWCHCRSVTCQSVSGLFAASNSAYSYTFLHGVVCRLSHSCTLFKPFDGFRCHLADTFVGSTDTLC